MQPQKGDLWYDTSATVLNFHNGVAWLAIAVSAGQFDILSNAVSVLSQAVSVISQSNSVLSQSVSVLSNSVSVISQSLSVLSQAHSVLSQAFSVISNNVSVLSNQVSVLSQQVSVLSQAHSVLSQAFSVVSAGLGIPTMKVVTNTQTISGTVTTQISGLSVVLAAGKVFEYEAGILFNMSVADTVKFNVSGTTSTVPPQGGRWTVGTGISATQTENFQGFPGGVSATAATTSVFFAELHGMVKTSASFTLALFAWASAAAKDINIKAGSWLRAYQIG